MHVDESYALLRAITSSLRYSRCPVDYISSASPVLTPAAYIFDRLIPYRTACSFINYVLMNASSQSPTFSELGFFVHRVQGEGGLFFVFSYVYSRLLYLYVESALNYESANN